MKILKIGVVIWNPCYLLGGPVHMCLHLAMVTGEITVNETGHGESNKIILFIPMGPLTKYHNDYSEYNAW